MNPAQQQAVGIGGATPPLQVTLDQKLVNVVVSPDGTSLTITATQATGNDTLHVVDANGARADLPIRIAFNAGTIVPQTTLTVTGNPVQPDWLTSQVDGWVTRLTRALPGATSSIGNVSPPAEPLPPGRSEQFVVPVQIEGNGRYFDQSGSTTVTVQNLALEPFAPELLFYDDDPEHVAQDGVLFRGTVAASQPTRLYYYHDNAADPRVLLVALSSNSQDPTSVQLVEAQAGPNMDVMQVGHMVTKNFLVTKAQGEGIVVNLSQDDPYLLAAVPLALRQLAAGAVDLRVLSGGPVVVTVMAASAGVDPRSLIGGPILPGDGHHRTGVFKIAGFGSDALSFTAGGPDATLVIGDTDPTPANVDSGAAGHDYGDYGVTHTIAVTMNNPGASPFTAYLYFKPLAGPARASFLVDNNIVEIGCVRTPTPYQVTSLQLPPGEMTRVTVQTMTDGASFYPALIGVTSTPPQPTAPPVNAPDGCFPKPEASPPAG